MGDSGKQFTGQVGGTLSIVATPIGNLGDMTERAVATLREAEVIYCEDTRITGKLLQHFGIQTKMSQYHEHNAARVRPHILNQLGGGMHLALVSDAGTPLISDPGYKLVQEVLEAGHTVVPIPGACAAIAALCASGLPSAQFSFLGFLHPKGKARADQLATAQKAVGTLLFYESSPKLARTLRDLAETLGNRDAVILREITKRFEERLAGSLLSLAEDVEKTPLKGEIVLLVAPKEEGGLSEESYDALLKGAMQHLSVKDAAAVVATQTGSKRSALYQRALELNGDDK